MFLFLLWLLFLFILNQAYMISPYYPCYSTTIFVYCEHPSEVPTTLLAVQPLLHLGMLSVFSLFHYPSHKKILINSFLPYIFLYPLMGKTLGLSLPISLACIKWPQPVYYLFWAKMPSQQSNSQKRSWLDSRNRPFPPSTKPHPP